MSFDYASLAKRATALIQKFGRDITLKTTDQSGAVNERTVRVVFLERVISVLEGSGVQIGDWHCICGAAGAPKPGDRLDGHEESLVVASQGVKPIQPGLTVVAYEFYARKG